MVATFPSSARGFTRGNGAGSIASKEPLTIDALARVAPSILAGGAHGSRSSRYTYVPTIQIVEHLQAAGYGVFAAMQSGSRDADKRSHTKHMIRLRPLNQSVIVGGSFPEIVMVNSHDGTSAYKLMAGIFRLVCSNGMIVAESTIEDVRVKHTGNILAGVSEAVDRLSGSLPLLGSKIEQFQSLRLDRPEQEAFATAALSTRWEGANEAPIGAQSLLAPRRSEDMDPTLWNTLNTVQESLIRGGARYRRETDRGIQRRKVQPVRSVDGTTTVNRALWVLAEEMAKLKAGASSVMAA